MKANEGFHILPNQKHKITNGCDAGLHFLVISEPKAHGDRVYLEEPVD